VSSYSQKGDWRFFTNKIPALIEDNQIFKFKVNHDTILVIDEEEYPLEELLQDAGRMISFENLRWISNKTSFESKGIKGQIITNEGKLFIDYIERGSD
jgi:hypothetical protein